MRVLGLVGARGGSKGVPRKNLRELGGKPLIGWAIETGLASEHIDKVVVTTDDEEIAEVARRCGAEVPFLRPPELATDTALQIDALIHAVCALEEQGERFDAVALLQPTVPLRAVEDVDGTLALLRDSGADSAITVCPMDAYHPLTQYTRGADGTVTPLLADAPGEGVRRQDFPACFWRTGAVYATRRSVLVEERSLYGRRTVGHVVPPERSFNIDSEFDWDLLCAWVARDASGVQAP